MRTVNKSMCEFRTPVACECALRLETTCAERLMMYSDFGSFSTPPGFQEN